MSSTEGDRLLPVAINQGKPVYPTSGSSDSEEHGGHRVCGVALAIFGMIAMIFGFLIIDTHIFYENPMNNGVPAGLSCYAVGTISLFTGVVIYDPKFVKNFFKCK